MSNKPERNKPCPCGSGEKYKKCCGTREMPDFSIPEDLKTGTLLDEYMMLVRGMTIFFQSLRQFDDDKRALNLAIQNFEEHFRPGEPGGCSDSVFMSWSLLDLRFGRSQKTVCERFIESEFADNLREPAPLLLKNLAKSYLAFYQLKGVSDDNLLFEEIGTGCEWRVHRVNEPYERSVTLSDIWYVRFVGGPEDAFIFTAPLIFPSKENPLKVFREGIEVQKEGWRQYKEKRVFECEMFADSCKAAVNSWLGMIMGTGPGSARGDDVNSARRKSGSDEGDWIDMKLTKEQYNSLIKMVYLGNWVINAIRVDDRVEEFDDLEQHIYSFYKEFGLEKYITRDKKSGEFCHTTELEQDPDIERYIQEYDDDVFRGELADRLAHRDLIREFGEAGVKKMSKEERFFKICDLSDKYEEEIEKYGIERMEIKDKGGL